MTIHSKANTTHSHWIVITHNDGSRTAFVCVFCVCNYEQINRYAIYLSIYQYHMYRIYKSITGRSPKYLLFIITQTLAARRVLTESGVCEALHSLQCDNKTASSWAGEIHSCLLCLCYDCCVCYVGNLIVTKNNNEVEWKNIYEKLKI